MSDIANPHDRFFKEVISREDVARDFVLHYLPADIVDFLDVDSLEIRKDTFVDKDLMEHFSDLLYAVNLKSKGPAYVYLLFEHKSFSDPLTSLHLMRYMVRIWEQALKQGEARPLPPIIPVVIYHGRVKWKAGLEFCNLFDLPKGLENLVPNFRYLLCDLSHYSDEDIKGAVMLRAAFLLLKHIFSEDLGERLPEILKLLSNLVKKRSGSDYLETILRYVASGSDKITKEDIENAVRDVLKEKGDNIMPTVAEQWIEQGIQQGMQQGMQQGFLQALRGALIEVLEDRFETVPQTFIKSLREINDPDVLKSLHKKALRMRSLKEFRNAVQAVLTQNNVQNKGSALNI